MSEEVELAAKVSGEVASALVEQSGILDVPREYTSYIVSRIHLRHQVSLVERAMAAAQKIKESGLPPRAFSALDEPLLTAILEGAAEETDPGLQQAWENLLANSAVAGGAEVRRAFPKILAELEPAEARLLDALSPDLVHSPFLAAPDLERKSESATLFDNLERLGLIRYEPGEQDQSRVYGSIGEFASAMREQCTLTALGIALVSACRSPSPGNRS